MCTEDRKSCEGIEKRVRFFDIFSPICARYFISGAQNGSHDITFLLS